MNDPFGDTSFNTLQGLLHRIVESQESVATTAITSSLNDQELLEDMIEASKPPLPKQSAKFHYLLSTPFRYPPLKYGSRFGATTEPSLFYGSLTEPTCIAEAAYYRFVLYQSMKTPPPKPIRAQHTLFTVRFHSAQGVDTRYGAFAAHQTDIGSPVSYAFSQRLGRHLREAGTQCLLFTSARDPAEGANVALYSITALRDKKPRSMANWQSETSPQLAHFSATGIAGSYKFPLAAFSGGNPSLPIPV